MSCSTLLHWRGHFRHFLCVHSRSRHRDREAVAKAHADTPRPTAQHPSRAAGRRLQESQIARDAASIPAPHTPKSLCAAIRARLQKPCLRRRRMCARSGMLRNAKEHERTRIPADRRTLMHTNTCTDDMRRTLHTELATLTTTCKGAPSPDPGTPPRTARRVPPHWRLRRCFTYSSAATSAAQLRRPARRSRRLTRIARRKRSPPPLSAAESRAAQQALLGHLREVTCARGEGQPRPQRPQVHEDEQ